MGGGGGGGVEVKCLIVVTLKAFLYFSQTL